MTFHKMNKIIQKSFLTILMCLVLFFNVINIADLKYWTTNGTGIDSNVDSYAFTPFLSSDTDVITQVISPAHDGLESIEVRLANEWPDKVDCVLQFDILDSKRNCIYSETVHSDQIENWRYYKLETGFIFNEKDKYTLNIKCSDNYSDVPFKVFLCNETLKENKQLTFNNQTINAGLDLMYNYYTFPLLHFLFLGGVCIIGIWIAWNDECTKLSALLKWYFIVPLTASALFFIVEKLSGGDIFSMKLISIAINILLICMVYFFMLVIIGNTAVAGVTCSVLLFILALVNHFVLQFRGTVILPSDIFSITTARNVVENYSISSDHTILTMTTLFAFIIVLLIKTNNKLSLKERMMTFILAIISLIIVILPINNSVLALRLDLGIRQDMQTIRSHQIGFLYNLAQNAKYFYIGKPENYSVEIVENIYAKTEYFNDSNQNIKPVNVIVIMNESLAELQSIDRFETNEYYLDNFYQLASEKNSKIGKCVVPVFGGGTSCSEFEFLTGYSMLFLGNGIAPYQQFIHSESESIATLFNNIGYESIAVHPANPKSWNRDIAYPYLGFNNFISTDSTNFSDATYCRYWIDDKSLFNELEQIYQGSVERLFLFAITIQCHGGYDYSDFKNHIVIEPMRHEYTDVNQYLSLVDSSDNAFGELIDGLKKSAEPTIVLMFGDHFPSLDTTFYEELMKKKQSEYNKEDNLKLYTTPYIVWANYEVDFSEIPDIISTNLLAPYILKVAEVEMSDYFKYLYELSQEYPVISPSGILDACGNFYSYEQNSICYKRLNEYEVVQYYEMHKGK